MKKLIFIAFFISASFFICDNFSFSFQTHKLRVISLAPSTTEILFALGLDEEIVGVSTFCDYPQKAKAKEKVGTFSQPNIEKILYLKPDIIFCTGLEQTPIVNQLKQLNLRVFVSDPSNIEELYSSIKDIGNLINKESEANDLVKKMRKTIKEAITNVKLTPEEKKPEVFVEIWHDPLMTAGKGSFVDEIITLACGINIAADIKRPYSYIDAEQVIKRNPDCIILTYMSAAQPQEKFRERLGWQDIKAVRNNRIYNDIDADILLRPGPRLAEGVKELCKRLYSYDE